MQFGKFHKVVLVSFALGATVVFAANVWSKPAKKAGEVAALVNGQPIIAAAVQGEIKGILGRFQEQGRKPSETEMATIRESVLDKMIKLELLSQESKKAGIAVNNNETDHELKG